MHLTHLELESVIRFLETKTGPDVIRTVRSLITGFGDATHGPTKATYISAVKQYSAHHNDVNWAIPLLQDIDGHFMIPSMEIVGPIFYRALEVRDVNVALEAYERICAKGVDTRTYYHSKIIQLLAEERRIDEAEAIHQKLIAKQGDGPGFAASRYIALIKACMLENDMQRAKKHVDSMLAHLERAGWSLKRHEKWAASQTALLFFARTQDTASMIPLMPEVTEKGVIPTARTVEAMAEMYAAFSSSGENGEVYRNQILDRIPKLDLARFWSGVIRALAAETELEEAGRIFTFMQKQHYRLTDAAICDLLNAYGRKNDLKGCERTLKYVKHHVSNLNTVFSNIIINTMRRFGQLDLCRSVFDGMAVRDVQSYTMMLLAYSDVAPEDGIVEMKKLLDEMVRAGIPRSERIYAIVIGGCRGRLDLAEKYFHMMESERIQATVYTYGAMMRVCAEARRGNEMAKWHSRMGANGIRPTWATFSVMIRCFLDNKDHLTVKLLHTQMRKMGIRVNEVMAIMLMESYHSVRDVRGAQGAFEEYRAANARISEDVFHVLIDGFAEQGDVKRVEDWINKMRLFALKPTAVTKGIRMKAASFAGNHEGVMEQYEKLKDGDGPNSVHVTMALDSAGFSGTPEEAQDLFEEARRAGKVPVNTYNAFIEAMGRHGRDDAVLGALYGMMEDGLLPTRKTYLTAMSLIGRPKRDEVRAFFNTFAPEVMSKGLPFSDSPFPKTNPKKKAKTIA
ncbi:hypothetical protein HK097_007590 [Rhizophlyctis rosea]|uniref:Uncharacterized protein n=1 Tax=Rhizophlyctis rosea TaxID=64517 RepID=A0AAD5X9H4_9FUNG|nr:hypothetical protein HK097_007590 [Rhizophlyctis rosea]